MKIGKIELKENVYYVTKIPNWLQGLFGVKEKVERYRTYNEVFHFFPQYKVFYSSDGKQVNWMSKMNEALNNYPRRF